MAKRRKAITTKFCADRVVPFLLKPDAAAKAIDENPANAPKHIARKRLPGVTSHPLKMALQTGKRWLPGRTLRIRFMDGSKKQKAKVRTHAEQWLEFANLKFAWVTTGTAEIRISFGFDSGSWSAVGTDALSAYFPKKEPTMNFGWVTDDSDEADDRAVVLHEFGHALAAIHEHQIPEGGIVWNEKVVIEYFKGAPNYWSEADTRYNVLQKYDGSQLNSTKFDPRGIMLYAFPPEFIKAPASLRDRGTMENTRLSARDKSFIRKMYP